MTRALAILLLLLACLAPVTAHAADLIVSGVLMSPTDVDARRFNRPGYGLSGEYLVALPGTQRMCSLVIGLEGVNLLSKSVTLRDPVTGLRVEQQTSQELGRASIGLQFGSRGRGTLRPFGGATLAWHVNDISVDVVVPDDTDRQNEIRQHLRGRTSSAFGWDAYAGVDVTVGDYTSIVGAVHMLHAYGQPQQLGPESITIQPSYVQARLGVCFADILRRE